MRTGLDGLLQVITRFWDGFGPAESSETNAGLELAGATGFEPAISCVTGRCVKPGYTTPPQRRHSRHMQV
jgi:hypothetical protein